MRIAQRPVLVLLLVLFSTLPIAVSVVLTVSAKQQEAESALDTRLTEISRASAFELKSDIKRFHEILLTSAQNPAHAEVLLDPSNRIAWKHEVDASLANLTTIFPGMIDEACRIDSAGVELGRVVQGKVAPDYELSPDEAKNPFFKATTDLHEGRVHSQMPYISPDTNRWVISVSTPIYSNNKNYGILHFEVPLAYYQRSLESLIPTDGYLALVGPSGEVYLQSGTPEPRQEKFLTLSALFKDANDQALVPNIVSGTSGFGNWKADSKLYRLHYEQVELAPDMKMSVLVGLTAVPGLAAQLTPLILPLLLWILVASIAAVALVALLIRPLENIGPAETADFSATTTSKQRGYIFFVLVISLVFASGVAYAIDKLHEKIKESHQAELILVRAEGLANSINSLQADGKLEGLVVNAQQAEKLNSALTQSVNQFAAADGEETASQVTVALQQYQRDNDELNKLFSAGRTAEAYTWADQRVSQSYSSLLNVIADTKSVYNEAASRAGSLANIGSAIALILAALFMALLFLRVEHVRRAANAAAEAALRRSEKHFRSLVQNSSDVVTIIDAGATISYQGASINRVFGYEPTKLVGGSLIDLVHPDDALTLRSHFEDIVSKSEENSLITYRVRHSDGSWRYVETTINNLLDDPSVRGLVLNTRDISERKALEDQLAYRAFHDPLTDLPNRALFMERLEHATIHDTRRTESLAVLFLDLDGFKRVNDSLGHKMGDLLLVEVGNRLKSCLRPADTVARLGGDEFTILLEDIGDLRDAVYVAERITEKFQAPFYLLGQDIFISVSIGIALGDSGKVLPDRLVGEADMAMYEAKNMGKARYVIFDPALNSRAQEYVQLESELRRAVEQGEFRVHYQPIIELETGKVIEAEALVRWQHPERGMILPGEFITLAEETGLIIPIGHWVLEEACQQARCWQVQFPDDPPLTVSVNLSVKQIQDPAFVQNVVHILKESGLHPDHLKLEITESLAMEDSQSAIATLHELRALGIRLAIDDFGSGYSTLVYLRQYPVDSLKVDRLCIAGLDIHPEDTAIVHAALACAKVLGLSVIAEGVESSEQLARLRLLGCSHAQGYYFARPLDHEAMTALLVSQGQEEAKFVKSEALQRGNRLALKGSPA